MEDLQLQQLWKQIDEQSAAIHRLTLQNMQFIQHRSAQLQQQKASRKMNQLKRVKWLAVATGLLWILFLSYLVIYSFSWNKIFFLAAAIPLIVITAVGIIVYFKHIFLINEVNNAISVIEAQQRLIELESSTLNITRILFLQLPFYCFWFVSPAMIENSPWGFWGIVIPITLLFTWLAVWLYQNIKLENAGQRWFKILFGSAEWTAIQKAKSFLDEINEFKIA